MPLVHLHKLGRKQFWALAQDFSIRLNVKIEGDTVLNLIEGLTQEYS
jgi:hypothetical protein